MPSWLLDILCVVSGIVLLAFIGFWFYAGCKAVDPYLIDDDTDSDDKPRQIKIIIEDVTHEESKKTD